MVRFDTEPVVVANANPGTNTQAPPNGGQVQQPRRDGSQPVPPDFYQQQSVQQQQQPNGAVRPGEVAGRRFPAQSTPQRQQQINPADQYNGQPASARIWRGGAPLRCAAPMNCFR